MGPGRGGARPPQAQITKGSGADHEEVTMAVTMALVRDDSPRTRAIVTVIVMTITDPGHERGHSRQPHPDDEHPGRLANPPQDVA
jgi:hypothetical protein